MIRPLRDIARIAVIGAACSAWAVVVGVGPAGAGTTSADDLSKRYGLLRESDLPTGYALDEVRRETGGTAFYIEVEGDCDGLDGTATFSGGDPVNAKATFEEETSGSRGGQGIETVYTFDDDGDAKSYFGRFDDSLDEMVDCGLMTDGAGNIGTFSALSVGKVGNQRNAVAFEPRADRYTRVGLARAGDTVVYLELYDDAATDAEFAALLKTAVKRAR